MGQHDVTIDGFVEPGFERVADAFKNNFIHNGDVGASVCVYHQGRAVVDLWGGLAEIDGPARPWTRDTLCLMFSSTKGITATCVHLLVQRGLLDLDAPVASYWPEFAAAGKQDIPLRWVLTHQAGLAAITSDVTLDDITGWTGIINAVGAQEPNWEPGTAHGYHARTFGWILGEVVRRVTGRTIGQFFADEIAGPLELDMFIGLPPEELPRVAHLYSPEVAPEMQELMDQFMGPDTLLGQVLSGPSQLFGYNDMWNSQELLTCEMPSSNGIGNARGLARLYAGLIAEVDGHRILTPETVDKARAVAVNDPDKVIGIPMPFGLGYMTPPPFGPEGSFGHFGAGGSLGIASPEEGWTMGYVMNQMQLGLTGDARSISLLEAVQACVDTPPSGGSSP